MHLDRQYSCGKSAASSAALHHRSPEGAPRSFFIITSLVHHLFTSLQVISVTLENKERTSASICTATCVCNISSELNVESQVTDLRSVFLDSTVRSIWKNKMNREAGSCVAGRLRVDWYCGVRTITRFHRDRLIFYTVPILKCRDNANHWIICNPVDIGFGWWPFRILFIFRNPNISFVLQVNGCEKAFANSI